MRRIEGGPDEESSDNSCGAGASMRGERGALSAEAKGAAAGAWGRGGALGRGAGAGA
jgi:hypothetical protein